MCFSASIGFTLANPIIEKDPDTLSTRQLDEVLIVSSGAYIKETNALKAMPGSFNLFSETTLEQKGILRLSELTNHVPNLHMPEYGSKMTNAIYIRGIGARSSGQSIGIYVDGVPYMNKSTFSFDLVDVKGLEVLRGPQGTLYGRNAMGGIIKIYTRSAFDTPRLLANVGGGSYGYRTASVKGNSLLSDKWAISASGYYNGHDGYNKNHFTNKYADHEDNAGGQLKLAFRPDKSLEMSLSNGYDYSSQGAFPYQMIDKKTGLVQPINYNDEGHYERNVYTSRFLLRKDWNEFIFSSATGYQYLNDDMKMDQDYSPLSIFTINQKQTNNSITQEFVLKNKKQGNYQWSTGLFGFYDYNSLNAPVMFKSDGIKLLLQPNFDHINNNPNIPVNIYADASNDIEVASRFKRPTYGVALYHQSSINDLFIRGLSATVGLRLDYEHQQFDYYSHTAFPILIQLPNMPMPIPFQTPSTIEGELSKNTWQVLPKLALMYSFSPDANLYFSVAKGYKAGGFNEQVFADLIMQQQKSDMMNVAMGQDPKPIENLMERTSFLPEHSWSFELGTHSELFNKRLNLEASVYYSNINNIQLTQFIENSQGRIISNGGKAQSCGAELGLRARIAKGFTASANYGFTHATFRDYPYKKPGLLDEEANYKGNYVPFIPMNTFAVNLDYSKQLSPNYWIKRLFFNIGCNGAGKIYWTEDNSESQNLYAVMNARMGASFGKIELSLWSENITNSDYSVFLFKSMGNTLTQRSRPMRIGANLSLHL